MQFECCFSIIDLYIDIYGYGMLSMGFWLLSRRNIISIVWRNLIRLISSSYLPIYRMYFLFKRIRLLQTVRNGIIQYAAVVAPPGLKLCNPYFLISETNGRNASMNNSTIRVLNMKREITLFNLPQLRYTTSIKYMFIVHFALLFYIVHCCIDIEDRSLSGLYISTVCFWY
jgi:hypothetical protein